MLSSNFEFEWDPAKAAANLRKHGVEFDEAETVFLDPYACIMDDPDHSADEQREIILGYSEKNHLVLVSYKKKWVATGTHAELAATNALYRALVASQQFAAA